MTADPTVSLVMPVYNGARHIGEALESILAQTYADFEIVAVDDGSTDESWTILTSFATRDDRVRPHRLARNAGHHVASNTAIELSRGRFIARLDQDDLAERSRLARSVDAFESNPDVGLVHSWYERWLPDGTRVVRTPPATDTSLRIALLFNNVVCHSALAFRADVLTGLDDWYRDLPGPQDFDLIVRVLERTRSYCIPEPLAVYRQSTMAMTSQYSDRMDDAVAEISARQLGQYVRDDRIAGTRRVFSLSAGPNDSEYVRDVRALLAGVEASDARIDREELARVSRSWTARAVRAAIARRGGLPRSPRFVAELVRGDVRGAADGVFAGVRRRRRVLP